ncbi:MAG: hypothetical protein WCI02_02260 [Planctomycetota bacterium]
MRRGPEAGGVWLRGIDGDDDGDIDGEEVPARGPVTNCVSDLGASYTLTWTAGSQPSPPTKQTNKMTWIDRVSGWLDRKENLLE